MDHIKHVMTLFTWGPFGWGKIDRSFSCAYAWQRSPLWADAETFGPSCIGTGIQIQVLQTLFLGWTVLRASGDRCKLGDFPGFQTLICSFSAEVIWLARGIFFAEIFTVFHFQDFCLENGWICRATMDRLTYGAGPAYNDWADTWNGRFKRSWDCQKDVAGYRSCCSCRASCS